MIILSLIQAMSAIYIAYRVLMALNAMTHLTRLTVRVSYIALLAGTLAAGVSCITMRDVFEPLFAFGVALYMYFNRREENAPEPDSLSGDALGKRRLEHQSRDQVPRLRCDRDRD